MRFSWVLGLCLLSASILGPCFSSTMTAKAQQIRVSAGGGWAPATSTLDFAGTDATGQEGTVELGLGSGRHLYAAAGFVRQLSSWFDLGVRVRAQESRFQGQEDDLTDRCAVECTLTNSALEGNLRALTAEGRLIITSTGRIKPYLLVGLGVVHTTMDGTRLDFQNGEDPIQFSDVEVTDAGGDVGVGASLQLLGGLHLDTEFRVTGSLPGGKENAVTVLPFSIGLGYNFSGP